MSKKCSDFVIEQEGMLLYIKDGTIVDMKPKEEDSNEDNNVD